ncbi:MAG TPA: substrate-binding domain-containing protein [Chthonomonadaceae bacterium]|nr:substrate-binding domain-containing protein [Chthonomonadaceae bacterium]
MQRLAPFTTNRIGLRVVRALLCLALCTGPILLSGCRTGLPEEGKGPVKAAGKGKFHIAGIGFQDDQFFKLVELGMKNAAQKDGVDLSTGNSAGSLDKEISLVDTYAAQKVDAIAIAPQSAKASIPALQRAHDRGIKIITYDSSIDADFPESNIKSDPVALGQPTGAAAYDYILKKLGGKAKVALIGYRSFLPEPASKRRQGFYDEIKKLPGVQVVAEQDAWIASQAVNVVESILTAHPDINLIWAANEGGTVGAVTAVKNSGKAGKVAVFGTDISEQIADFLLSDDNILQAVTGQKPFQIGTMAIDTAVKALKGEKVEKQVALPGMLFTREKPDEVRKYRDYLHSLSQ